MSFDWQTEEDGDWDEQTWQQKPATAVSTKPPWRTIVMIIVLLVVAGAIIYQQVNQRLNDATSTIESDIFAAHNLISRAAASQDADLGKTVLSGRDMGWSRVQSELLATGLFYENQGLGLTLPDGEIAYAPLSREDERFVDLTLTPDLNGAELAYVRDYLAFTDDGISNVTLQQTAVYRRGKTRWLLAPPLEEFWGEWQTTEFDNVTFVYPQRDEEILLELTDNLQKILAETCDVLPELDCASLPQIQIRFDTDPESLLETADLANLYDNNLRLNLPTPTLVGLPIDNDGYEALLYAYGSNMVSALIGQSIAYECCDQAPMFQAIVTYQLSELGLANWPVTLETQKEMADSGVHVEMLFPYWSSNEFAKIYDEESWLLFGFVDFLVKQHASHETPLAILAQLNASRVYQSWLGDLAEGGENNPFGATDMISRDWWFYAMTQSEVAATSSQPISFPAQDLQVGCASNLFDNSEGLLQMKLNRYELNSESWREEASLPGFAFFNPLPQDNGVILQMIEAFEDQSWLTMLWRDGVGVEMIDEDDLFSISLGQADPDGRFLLYFTGITGEEIPEPRLLNIEDCLAGNCNGTVVDYTPYWSPDGQWVLLSDSHLFDNGQYFVDGRIFLLDRQNSTEDKRLLLSNTVDNLDESIEVEEGQAPFWINNEMFGFIQSNSPSDGLTTQSLIVMSRDDLVAQMIVQTADLHSHLPENQRYDRNLLFMRYVLVHPTDSDRLLLMASTHVSGDRGYLFEINRRTQVVEQLFEIDLSWSGHGIGFSPDGRFLVATGSFQQESRLRSQNTPLGALHLYDFETGEQQTIITNGDVSLPSFTFDWSLDGNWLAFVRDRNAIGLVAPAYDYQQTIFHDIGDCFSLAWINPLPPE